MSSRIPRDTLAHNILAVVYNLENFKPILDTRVGRSSTPSYQ